jgi:hypothetical protein
MDDFEAEILSAVETLDEKAYSAEITRYYQINF